MSSILDIFIEYSIFSVDACIDQQLTSLESCQLPTKQEIEHFKETQQKVEKIENGN